MRIKVVVSERKPYVRLLKSILNVKTCDCHTEDFVPCKTETRDEPTIGPVKSSNELFGSNNGL